MDVGRDLGEAAGTQHGLQQAEVWEVLGKTCPFSEPIDAGWWSKPSPVRVSRVRTFLLKLRNVMEKVRWGL